MLEGVVKGEGVLRGEPEGKYQIDHTSSRDLLVDRGRVRGCDRG